MLATFQGKYIKTAAVALITGITITRKFTKMDLNVQSTTKIETKTDIITKQTDLTPKTTRLSFDPSATCNRAYNRAK